MQTKSNVRNRVATRAALIILAVVAVLVALNAAMGALPTRWRLFNLVRGDDFSVSGKTRDWLATLDEDVQLYLIQTGGESMVDRDLYGFLEEYVQSSAHVSLRVVNPYTERDFMAPYGNKFPSDGSVLVCSEKRYRVIESGTLYYYHNTLTNSKFSSEEYDSLMESMLEADETGTLLENFVKATTPYFDGESAVTNAINFVLQEKVAVLYMLTGNGASPLNGDLQSLLSQTGYEIRTLLSLTELPTDCDLLVINAPSTDLSANESDALSGYLTAGGKLFLTTYYDTLRLDRLNTLLSGYGMTYHGREYVCDGNPKYYLSDSNGSYPELFNAHVAQHAATGAFVDTFISYRSGVITLSEAPGVTVTPWLYTSEAGYVVRYSTDAKGYEELPTRGEHVFGAIAERGDACITWLASPHALESTYNALSENSGNFMLTLSAMNYMTGVSTNGIAIEPTVLTQTTLNPTAAQITACAVILLGVLPLATFGTGLGVWISRKRR